MGRAVGAHPPAHRGAPRRDGVPRAGRAAGRSDPSLTQPARLPAEVGRLEFKAFDAIGDLALYGELLSLLTGLVLDDTLPGRRTTPDAAAHRHVAAVGLADDAVHAGTGALLTAAERALADRPPTGSAWPRSGNAGAAASPPRRTCWRPTRRARPCPR